MCFSSMVKPRNLVERVVASGMTVVWSSRLKAFWKSAFEDAGDRGFALVEVGKDELEKADEALW